MDRQTAFLGASVWDLTAFYDVRPEDTREVLAALAAFGVSEEDYRATQTLLLSGKPSQGFTISDLDRRASIMAVGWTESAAEFANTYSHEKGHLAAHIAKADGLDPFGEECQYVAGEIGGKTFPYAKRYLCDCCRQKQQQ